jgi:hypothetical protein
MIDLFLHGNLPYWSQRRHATLSERRVTVKLLDEQTEFGRTTEKITEKIPAQESEFAELLKELFKRIVHERRKQELQ